MARKVIRLAVGRQGSTRRRWTLLLSLIIAVGAGAVFMHTTLLAAVKDGFELDKNTVDSPPGAPEDWNTIYAAETSGGATTASAFAFIPDNAGGTNDATIFTGGGSKDDLDIPGWQHTAGSSPDKDELLNGYAARYGNNMYFGADRYAGNGSAQMGIWFFQNDVGPVAGGTFSGVHKDGDVLILSDFTNGGAATTIRVFRWNGPDDNGDCTAQEQADLECIPGVGAIDGTLDLLAGTENDTADCADPTLPLNAPSCATVNVDPISVPWPFFPKGAKGNGPFQVPSGQFYEGGIDLSAFPGLSNQCFASFLIETRSSPSVDAVLKDFVGGGFEACQSSVDTTPSDANKNALTTIQLGQDIYDYAVVTGTGSQLAPTGTMSFFICSPAQLTNGTCASGGTAVGSAVSLTPIAMSSPPKSEALSAKFTPTSVGTWCWRGEYSGDTTYPASSDSSSGECFTVTQLPASISTAQRWSVYDTATIEVGAAGTVLDGQVKFELFASNNCSGSVIDTNADDAVAVSGASPVTVQSATYNVTTTPGGPFAFSWKATYTSNNPGHTGVIHQCTEVASLTYANGSKITATLP
jgi:hypothetical protein